MLWIILLLALHTLAGGVSAGHLNVPGGFALFFSIHLHCSQRKHDSILPVSEERSTTLINQERAATGSDGVVHES